MTPVKSKGGRPSKLTDAQWEQVTKRAAEGESISALAREVGVSRSQVSDRVSNSRKLVKSLVGQIVELPVSLQRVVSNMVDMETAKRQNVANIGHDGTAIAAKLAALARAKVDGMTSLPAADDLRDVAAATQVMNAAAVTGVAQVKDSTAKEQGSIKAPNLDEVMTDLRKRLGMA
jgi:predicted transcriptional regulator